MQSTPPLQPSLPLFLGLTFLISWTLWITMALLGISATTVPGVILSLLAGIAPSTVAVLMLRRTSSPTQRQVFWQRVWRSGNIRPVWWGVILLATPLIVLLSMLVTTVLGGEQPDFDLLGQVLKQPWIMLPLSLMVMLNPLGEELGWRGLALDQLLPRWGRLKASLILGGVWWVWHLPLFFVPGTTHSSWGWDSVESLAFLATTLSLSVYMTWVSTENRGSILAPMLIHFLLNLIMGLIYPFNTEFMVIATLGLVMLTGSVVRLTVRGRTRDLVVTAE